jgi:hypothetical protein
LSEKVQVEREIAADGYHKLEYLYEGETAMVAALPVEDHCHTDLKGLVSLIVHRLSQLGALIGVGSAHGVWIDPEGKEYRDEVVVVWVKPDHKVEVSKLLARYGELAEQQEVLFARAEFWARVNLHGDVAKACKDHGGATVFADAGVLSVVEYAALCAGSDYEAGSSTYDAKA